MRVGTSGQAGGEESDELKGQTWNMRYQNGIVPYQPPGGLISRPLSPIPSSLSDHERLAIMETRQHYTDRRMDVIEMELRQRKTSFGERLKWAAAFFLVSVALGFRTFPEVAINIAATLGGGR